MTDTSKMLELLDKELRGESIRTILDLVPEMGDDTDQFGYREFYDNGTSMAMCSHTGWYRVTLNEDMSAHMSKHYANELISLNKVKTSFRIRTQALVNNKFLEELRKRDMCNSLLIYRREREVIRMYSFICYMSNHKALEKFVGEREYFENKVNLYEDELAAIFQKEKYQPLRAKMFDEDVVKNIFSSENNDYEESQLSKDNEEKIIQLGNYKISLKDYKYLKLVADGASYKEIGKRFGISDVTARHHVGVAKRNIGLSSRYQVKDFFRNSANNLKFDKLTDREE